MKKDLNYKIRISIIEALLWKIIHLLIKDKAFPFNTVLIYDSNEEYEINIKKR
jgi:hypothetical protein